MSKFSGLSLSVDVPQRMNIIHPITRQVLTDNDGKSAYIDLYSADSLAAKKQNREISRRRLAMAGRSRAMKLTPEEIENDQIELLVAITADWYLVSLDGEKIDIPFSASEARTLYGSEEAAWLREQVDDFAGDRANFTKASSKTS